MSLAYGLAVLCGEVLSRLAHHSPCVGRDNPWINSWISDSAPDIVWITVNGEVAS